MRTDEDLLVDAVDHASTIDLHRSNLLRMQVKELLDECRLDLENTKWASHAQEYLQLLTTTVRGISISEEGFQEQADKQVSVEIQAEGPSALLVEPIGCTKNRGGWTKRGGNAHVLPTFELMVKIPEIVFSKKDFMNYRYFDKRNLIAKRVAERLRKTKELGDVEFVWPKGQNCPPVLRLLPAKKHRKFQIDLSIGMKSINWIPEIRLVPNRQNIKRSGASSQFYNHTMLFDARHAFEDPELRSVFEHQSFEEALVLVQVWALQRGLWRNHDGWDKATVALFIVYLVRTRKINPRMTNLQVFTVIMQAWATTNWLGEEENESSTVRAAKGESSDLRRRVLDRQVIVLPLEGCSEAQTISKSSIGHLYAKQAHESPLTENDAPDLLKCYARQETYSLGPVFLDPSMSYNYLGAVSPNYSRLLQMHASKSLEALQQTGSAFEYLFMTRARFFQQWDMFFQLSTDMSRSDSWEFGARDLIEQLERGLGNRITALRVLSTGNGDLESDKSNTDQFPKLPAKDAQFNSQKLAYKSPTGSEFIVIGIAINPETCQRVVDRGPPAEETDNVKKFMDFWGKKAQLRRFKDGAVVPAIVWNDAASSTVEYQNGGRWNGGFVPKIIGHLVALHYSKKSVSFGLPHLLSGIDDVSQSEGNQNAPMDPWLAHNRALKSFESLSDVLRKSKAIYGQGLLPIEIDAVEPLSPSLRYSSLFPPIPHPFLGASGHSEKKVAGAITSDPMLIQIKFRSSSKWPTDLKAIGAAKTAMLIQLAKCLENLSMPEFDGPITVNPSNLEFGYNGYCFQLRVKAEPEILMLEKLESPSTEARTLLAKLTKEHVMAARHHNMVQALHTQHPTALAVVRLAKRWVASHFLSGHIAGNIIELMVAKVYSKGHVLLEAPSTISAGFCQFLHLLSSFDWKNSPLLVDPRGVVTDEEFHEIQDVFEKLRGPTKEGGPPLFIVSPYDGRGANLESSDEMDESSEIYNKWYPSVTSPEWVVVTRAAAVAKASYGFATSCISAFDDKHWGDMFTESPASLQSHSILFRVGAEFIVDKYSSSMSNTLSRKANDEPQAGSPFARSMKARKQGPSLLRSKVYRNLQQGSNSGVLTRWNPIAQLVETLERRFGKYALFFYNEYCPEAIGLVWRPNVFSPVTFSALASEHIQPGTEASDSVMKNANDVLREMKQFMKYSIIDIRRFDEDGDVGRKRKRCRVIVDSTSAEW